MRFRTLVSVLAAFVCSASFGQTTTSIDDVLNGANHPAALKLDQLTSRYKALRLGMAGSGGGMVTSLTAMMPMMMMSRAQPNVAGPDLYNILGTYWTTGELTTMAGHEFLVTYRLDMAMTLGPVTATNPLSVSLKLDLVRSDMIASISPEPDITPARLRQDLADAKVAFNDPGAVQFGTSSGEDSAILAPVIVQARLAAEHTSSLSNAKQIGLSMIMYANDYDDQLPYAQSTGAVIAVTQPYIKNPSLWWTADSRRFLFNMALAGASDVEVMSPSETIMVFAEKPADDGMREVCFADGHAKRLNPTDWAKYAPSMKLKLPKHGKPLPANLGEEYNKASPPAKT